MAEIKSTMELVMERAARMGKASSEEMLQDQVRKKGMQLTAEYLDGKVSSLMDALTDKDPGDQVAIRHGMVDALLRNIFLARDDIQKARVAKAVQGILSVGGNAGDLSTICHELQHIIDQYGQHREQLQQQLEDQVKMQYEQLLAQQTGQPAEGLNIDATMQPKFREEWAKIEAELNEQYNQVLEQHKNLLQERLS